jgi:hypothetical protein
VTLAARQDWAALGELDSDSGWNATAWQDALAPYFTDHGELPAGADARGPDLFVVTEHADRWTVRQILDDPAGDHDWGLTAEVDLAASDEAGEAVLRLVDVSRL